MALLPSPCLVLLELPAWHFPTPLPSTGPHIALLTPEPGAIQPPPQVAAAGRAEAAAAGGRGAQLQQCVHDGQRQHDRVRGLGHAAGVPRRAAVWAPVCAASAPHHAAAGRLVRSPHADAGGRRERRLSLGHRWACPWQRSLVLFLYVLPLYSLPQRSQASSLPQSPVSSSASPGRVRWLRPLAYPPVCPRPRSSGSGQPWCCRGSPAHP